MQSALFGIQASALSVMSEPTTANSGRGLLSLAKRPFLLNIDCPDYGVSQIGTERFQISFVSEGSTEYVGQ